MSISDYAASRIADSLSFIANALQQMADAWSKDAETRRRSFEEQLRKQENAEDTNLILGEISKSLKQLANQAVDEPAVPDECPNCGAKQWPCCSSEES